MKLMAVIDIRLSLLCILMSAFAFSQRSSEEIMKEIGLDYCRKSENSHWQGKSIEEIAQITASVATATQQDKSQEIAELFGTIKAENPDIDQNGIVAKFISLWTVTLIDDCPDYLTMTFKLLPAAPATNASLEKLALDVNAYLKTIADQPYALQYEMARDTLNSMMSGNKSLVAKDYGDSGDVPAQFALDAHPYLTQNSKPYMKAYLIHTNLEAILGVQ